MEWCIYNLALVVGTLTKIGKGIQGTSILIRKIICESRDLGKYVITTRNSNEEDKLIQFIVKSYYKKPQRVLKTKFSLSQALTYD